MSKKTKKVFGFGDLGAEEVTRISTEGVKAAIADLHAAGIPSVHGDAKGIYKLYPDGYKEYTKLYPVEENVLNG